MAIKKTFVPLMELLNENLTATVESIMSKATELASTKGRAGGTGGSKASSTFIKNAAGDTVAIFDYYFKKWMPLVGDEAVEFGKKASAASGYSSMSKEGTSHWTKQQQVAKKAITNLLIQVEEGELAPSDIPEAKEAIEAERKAIVETDAGFAERNDVIAYLEAEGEDLSSASVEDETED